MTYAQQELEAEYNGRYDSVREAYAATAADAALMGNDDYGRAEAEDNIRDMVATLLPTLSDDKVAKLEAWVEAQLPTLAKAIAAQLPKDAALDAYWKERAAKPDFTCTNCRGEFFVPHEGCFLDIHDEMVVRCIDCHVKNFQPCTDERCCA